MTDDMKSGLQPQDLMALIEVYYQNGWTDGLPVIPPSENSLNAMLDACGLKGEEVIGKIETRNVFITADKVAVNAVLAGCLPEYMPVIVAAVKGICHPDFGYHGPATSTGGAAVAVLVNGPIARELRINARDNVFGPGSRPNATIGRALRLLMMNAINTRPGALDRSTLGNPGKYTLCFAEDEEGSPWEPLHVERGFRKEHSTVTLFATEGIHQIYNQLSSDPEQLCITMADAMANLGSMNIVGQQDFWVVFAGEHQEVFRRKGWTKLQVKTCLYEYAYRLVADIKRAGRLPGPVLEEDEITQRHVVRKPDDILVISAGGRAGAFSSCLPGWGSHRATCSVTTLISRT
ncbi:MAG: hypothetical protein JXD19_12865 [Deltaproteobacteria bacterium]|nr:hypothetical protein [Deltaproteobacteria bacterium]